MFTTVLAVLTLALPTNEGEARWIAENGATFTTPDAWDTGSTPDTSTTAIFDIPGTYTVTIDQTELNDVARLLILDGDVRFRFWTAFEPAFAFGTLVESPLTPALIVDNAILTLEHYGGESARFHTPMSSVDNGGVLAVTDFRNVFDVDQTLNVGLDQSGTFIVDGSATTAGRLNAGVFSESTGSVTVASSTLDVGDMDLGVFGSATLEASGGSSLTSETMTVGQGESGAGSVVMRDPGTRLIVEQSMDIGLFGPGSLTIEDRAGVIAHDVVIGGFPDDGGQTGGEGHIQVAGMQSFMWATGDLWVGLLSDGILEVDAGASVRVDGDLRQSPTVANFAWVEIGISSRFDYISPAIYVAGAADRLPIIVELDEGFVPSLGDFFELIWADGGTGEPQLELPMLPPGIGWQVESEADRVGLVIVAVLAGDADGDGAVDANDLLTVIANWGPCSGCGADLNDDGNVDLEDLLIVLVNWT